MQKVTIHGGNSRKAPPALDRSAPDAMAVWRDSYLDYLAARNYSPATIDGRYKDINIFLIWAADRDLTQAGQISRPILETYQLWTSRYTTAKGKRISWSAHYKRLCTLKHWFRWMTRQNVIINNPASELEMPRTEKRLPTVGLTLSQIGTLLGVPDVLDPLGVRDRAMLEIFYSCGLRRSELCRLDLPDFNAERRTLHIRQGKGHRDRMVPVGEQAVHWIGRYVAEVRPRLCIDTRTQAIFLTGYGGPFNPDVITRMMTRWMQRAGLGGKGSCHLLRHTCATHMLEGGADIRYIQQLLGHAKLETTAIYTEVSIRQLQEVHARCHPSGRAAQAAANVPQ
jgi:integrase/recombinase XerD